MVNKEIKIIVAGSCASGKSTISYLLRDFLIKNGWDVDIVQNNNFDYADVDDFIEKIGHNIDERTNSLKDKTKISIEELQTYKTFREIDHSDIDPYGEENWGDSMTIDNQYTVSN